MLVEQAKQFIHPLQHGLLNKKCSGGKILNTNSEHDLGEFKGCNKHGHLCTVLLDDLNHITLSTQWKSPVHQLPLPWRHHLCTQQAWQLIPTNPWVSLHAHTPHTTLATQNTEKLKHSVDNPSEVRPTAVYPPSWNHVNSVCKVASATLQFIASSSTALHLFTSFHSISTYPYTSTL